jgi:hypothetical protein
MFDLLLYLALGTALLFVGPSLIPQQLRSGFADNAVRAAGVIVAAIGVFSTSYVYVPDHHLAQIFRVYGGGSLAGGRIIAVNGENGAQARIFTPGFHPEFLLNVFYTVDTSPKETVVEDGNIGVLNAKDGAPLRLGQAFADPFPPEMGNTMLDAEVFLKNKGQRGPQLTVLAPGTYRLNSYLWDVKIVPAKEVQAGFVGVVKSNVWSSVDLGTLKSDKPAKCEPIKGVDEANADLKRLAAAQVPVGCTGIWGEALKPGKYYFNPGAYVVTDFDTRGQVLTYAGGYTRATISLTVNAAGDIEQKRTEEKVPENPDNADKAVFVKMEGWDVPLELRVIAQVSPEQAPCVVAGLGELKQVEDRVITPSIRAIVRDVAGGTYTVTEPKLDKDGKQVLVDGKPVIVTINRPTKVLDLINQRPLIEKEIENRIRPEADKSCVTIREVRLGEPAIPPELLVAVRREQLATQLSLAFIQEKMAQDQRITSEKAKKTADQQGTLVTAEIGVLASLQNAEAAKNQGQGERDKLEAIAAGQKAQMEVLGVEATVNLRKFELAVSTLKEFFDKNPEVLTAALSNAQKFVPQVSVGGTESGIVGSLQALLGQTLSKSASPSGPQ